MKEDMIPNALIWLISRLVNYIAARKDLEKSKADLEGTASSVLSQTLSDRWEVIQHELEVWYHGLPEFYRPCARLEPSPEISDLGEVSPTATFSEIWYSGPMRAATMQLYHMARILLLINKPHASMAHGSTVANFLKFYRSIEAEVRHHSHEICGIAVSHAEPSIYVHQTQALFIAGQCLTEPHQQQVVVDLIRGVETGLGWVTEYRVQQLLTEWGWDEG